MRQYEHERLSSITLARGGTLLLGYSDDGAKDLVSIAWPEVESAGFPGEKFYDDGIALTLRDAAGNITAKTDPSGTREQTYQKNRLTSIDWTNGHLSPFKVLRTYDAHGRTSNIELIRNNISIHTITPAYTGLSDEISGMGTDGFAAAVTRDPASRRVTGFTRAGVTQSWERGTAGRITGAHTNSTVTGAPSRASALTNCTKLLLRAHNSSTLRAFSPNIAGIKQALRKRSTEPLTRTCRPHPIPARRPASVAGIGRAEPARGSRRAMDRSLDRAHVDEDFQPFLALIADQAGQAFEPCFHGVGETL